jgi:hypothetical protein
VITGAAGDPEDAANLEDRCDMNGAARRNQGHGRSNADLAQRELRSQATR